MQPACSAYINLEHSLLNVIAVKFGEISYISEEHITSILKIKMWVTQQTSRNVGQEKINLQTLKMEETFCSETLEERTPHSSEPEPYRPEILRPSIKYNNQ